MITREYRITSGGANPSALSDGRATSIGPAIGCLKPARRWRVDINCEIEGANPKAFRNSGCVRRESKYRSEPKADRDRVGGNRLRSRRSRKTYATLCNKNIEID